MEAEAIAARRMGFAQEETGTESVPEAMLREIGKQARGDIERMLDAKVYLELWVKVKEGWRNNQYQMRNFGYEEQ